MTRRDTPPRRTPRSLWHLVAGLCAVVFVAVPRPAQPASLPVPSVVSPGCQGEGAVTVPAQVELGQVLRDVHALRDSRQVPLFRGPNRALVRAVETLFDPSARRSKLEQFYTLLFHIAQYASHPGDEIAFDVPTALTLLLSSKVFSGPEFSRQIVGIHLNRADRARPRYRVAFGKPEVWLPLNQGLGFGVFREGMCQHAKALVFYGSFAFALAMMGERLVVSDFDNVDLWGTFGTRGLVDIDLNYVSVKSVEFLNGNAMGLVRAKVSRREFEVNQHFFLFELIARFVTDKSVQPIDW